MIDAGLKPSSGYPADNQGKQVASLARTSWNLSDDLKVSAFNTDYQDGRVIQWSISG